ncbi:hypothetical protein KW797_00755 [Candidatus Parcubacteria bacterium]|nr:hypothetical protein [Candidatus Parcubacteria bacterium]
MAFATLFSYLIVVSGARTVCGAAYRGIFQEKIESLFASSFLEISSDSEKYLVLTMRDLSIKSKLEHTSANIQHLGDLLFAGKMENTKINNVAHLVGDTLSNSTECFDYCARDIFEIYILPKYPKLKGMNVYFPFSSDQLKKEPFSLLSSIYPELYQHLVDIIKLADDGNNIDQSIIPASLPKRVRSLVNSKKHDDVIEINTKGGAELVSDFGGIKMVFPLKQIGVTETEIDHESMKGPMIIANGYELKETGEEVMTMCQFAHTSTKIILQNLYSEYLGSKLAF